MPFTRRAKPNLPPPVAALRAHAAFFPLLVLAFALWLLYRLNFAFPVWFDETIGKALFFGLPVWLYVEVSKEKAIGDSFSLRRMKPGLLMGIAMGGVFGFVTSLMAIWQRGAVIEAVPLFMSDRFWYEFLLGIFTGFWETLFFFSFVMTVMSRVLAKYGLIWQVLAVSLVFVIFHLPNTVLRFAPSVVGAQVFLLGLFAIGQALLFAGRKNAYALTLSHAIWGMVLLVYGW